MSRKKLTDENGEVRTLTRADIDAFRPLAEVDAELAAMIAKRKPGQRGKGLKPAKVLVTMRLDPDVIGHYKATGAGWQSRINHDLGKLIRDEGTARRKPSRRLKAS